MPLEVIGAGFGRAVSAVQRRGLIPESDETPQHREELYSQSQVLIKPGRCRSFG